MMTCSEYSVDTGVVHCFAKTSATRPAYDWTGSWAVEFKRKSYGQIFVKGVEPQKRWLGLVARFSCSTWHVRVTFHGTLQSAQSNATFAKGPKRRQDLENLCLCIDFGRVQLSDDTVTELIVSRNHDAQSQRLHLKTRPHRDSEYAAVADQLWVRLREDPSRVRYPHYNGGSDTPTKDVSEITREEELDQGVYKVRVDGDESSYVYKEMERHFYVPGDSDALEQELRNLERLRGTEAIVRLAAAVISKNPYQTIETVEDDGPAFLRGILLEYHPNGTLQDALRSPRPDMDGRWRVWAARIARALLRLHESGITHMDLKPSNVVISADWNAVLIDVSGIGGVTREWLSPEMLNKDDPLSQSIEARRRNDIWALGKMLSAMANASWNGDEKQLLRSATWDATQAPSHISLRDAIAKLSSELSQQSLRQNSFQSTSSGSNPPSVTPPV